MVLLPSITEITKLFRNLQASARDIQVCQARNNDEPDIDRQLSIAVPITDSLAD